MVGFSPIAYYCLNPIFPNVISLVTNQFERFALINKLNNLNREIRTMNALIIDDDPCMRLLVHDFLEQSGMQVEEASDGAEGLAAIQERKPDAVLLDIEMPGKDGFAVCRELRKISGAEF